MGMNDRNLVITGFMGTGKSEVGRIIAARLEREFVDSDQLVEARAGRTIPEIFEQDGEAHFRALEAEVCRELSVGRGWVVATGGWTLGPPANRAAVEAGGMVVCLHADAPTLIARLGDPEGRPMLQDDDWQERMQGLLAQRQPTYRSFPFQVDTSRLTKDQIADRVLALWDSFAEESVPDALPVKHPHLSWTVESLLRMGTSIQKQRKGDSRGDDHGCQDTSPLLSVFESPPHQENKSIDHPHPSRKVCICQET